jgi:hypothetical protein
LLRKVQLAGCHLRGHTGFLMRNAEQVLASWELGEAYAQALDAGELDVYYQPKVQIQRPGFGVEALMRWIQNGQPVASPEAFIPLAEEAGPDTEDHLVRAEQLAAVGAGQPRLRARRKYYARHAAPPRVRRDGHQRRVHLNAPGRPDAGDHGGAR